MPRAEKVGGPKSPLPIDVEVGKRIRVYRERAKLSQTQLANALNLTFQQVQKYEAGINRVAPSRLEVIACVCGVAVSAFLPSLDGQKGGAGQLPFNELKVDGAQDLLAAYVKIKRKKVRHALVALAEDLACLA